MLDDGGGCKEVFESVELVIVLGVQTQETFLRSRTRSLVLAAARSGRYVPSWGGLHCVYIFKSYIVTTEFPTKN